jgi:hypothetical protein
MCLPGKIEDTRKGRLLAKDYSTTAPTQSHYTPALEMGRQAKWQQEGQP